MGREKKKTEEEEEKRRIQRSRVGPGHGSTTPQHLLLLFIFLYLVALKTKNQLLLLCYIYVIFVFIFISAASRALKLFHCPGPAKLSHIIRRTSRRKCILCTEINPDVSIPSTSRCSSWKIGDHDISPIPSEEAKLDSRNDPRVITSRLHGCTVLLLLASHDSAGFQVIPCFSG